MESFKRKLTHGGGGGGGGAQFNTPYHVDGVGTVL